MSSKISHVAIIGGGMTGPALALNLQSHGIRSTIYESTAADFSRTGSMALCPNALRVLDHLGLYSSLKYHGYSHDRVEIVNSNGSPLGKLILGSEKAYGYRALRLYRRLVRDELIKEVQRRGIEIRFGMKFVGIEKETKTGATVKFESGETVEAGIVVGADGLNSSVRSHLNAQIIPTFSGQVAVIGFTKRQRARHSKLPEACMILGTTGSFAMMPTGSSDDFMFFATLEVEDRSSAQWRAFEANKEALATMLRERFDTEAYPDVVRRLVTETPLEGYTCWPFRLISGLEHYISPLGRVIVTGDAAHAIPPSVGQAGAISLEDAETLAITISHAQSADPSTMLTLLSRWEKHRQDRVQKVAELTKAGSDLRKGFTSEASETSKAQALRDLEQDLSWLYSYEAKDVEAALRSA